MRRETGRWRAGMCSVAALVVLAGCSSTTPGNPEPTSASAGGTSATGTTKPLLTLPPRPATLSVAGIDPCKLVPQGKKAELGIDRPANTSPGGSDTVIGGKDCSYSVTAWGVYLLELSDKFTAQQWIDRTKGHPESNALADVGGYTAVVTYRADRPGGCSAVVDISDTAVLGVVVLDRRDYTAMDGKVLCANTVKAARVALSALKTMQK